jgi:hypothetical protein
MGRQTTFHVLPPDAHAFFEFACSRGPITITLKSSDSPVIVEVRDPEREENVMTLWNRRILPQLERKIVLRSGGPTYFRVEDSLPTIEFSPSRIIRWDGKAALLQGRIYGFFSKQSWEYEHWYNALSSWIRRHFVRNPIGPLRGYVGPTALEWFKAGGFLLPMVPPALTPTWIAQVNAQHAQWYKNRSE